MDIQGHDILAVGVGENHMIAMTTNHKIFVVGIGGNGQLGMAMDQLEDWKEVSPPLKNGQQIVDIHAGYKNSFVLVQNLI
jgi:alpha-tubulin suppressor-like RCC1 family protein